MLVEDLEERSSANYCHDEALKLLKRIIDARHHELTPSEDTDSRDDDNESTPSKDTDSRDDDNDSTTPKPSMAVAQSTAEFESVESETSTSRLAIQSASSDDSKPRIRETVEKLTQRYRSETVEGTYIDENLIASPRSLANSTSSEKE